MKIIRADNADFNSSLQELFERPAFSADIQASVKNILDDVRDNGDAALCRNAKKFDGVDLKPDNFCIPQKELESAERKVKPKVAEAIRTAHRQIEEFASQRIPEPWSYSPRKGVILGERFAPFDRIGAYVPGGTAPLISTVLHTVSLAAAAGVKEIVVVTPPRADKTVHPALLYAARQAGATEVYCLGGVYAIGALAYGTESINAVEKIVGPGNAYVTAAKREVYGHVALDLVAGPSEIMIIADDTANPEFIAADMLSQIEHGSGNEQAVLLTTEDKLIPAVEKALNKFKHKLHRKECIDKCLDKGIFMVQVKDLIQAAEIASKYAPEHLEIITRRPGSLAKKVTAAGAIFLGPWTPEPVGDFVAGPSHVLPTGGAARYFSGLTVEQFFRRMSVVHYQQNALSNEAKSIEAIAEAEGLDAHALSVKIRNSEHRSKQ
ncbi:MAG: histidinol dehydrogenase [Lentisphaeria bacterium]